jgi:hypothetical protein
MRHDLVHVVLNAVGTIRLFNTINFHCIVAFTLTLNFFLFKFLILTATAVRLQILAAIIRYFPSSNGTFTLCTSHLSIFNHGIRSSLATFLDLFFLLLLSFLGSILVSIGDQVGLRLVRWEFGWSGSFRVPVD